MGGFLIEQSSSLYKPAVFAVVNNADNKAVYHKVTPEQKNYYRRNRAVQLLRVGKV